MHAVARVKPGRRLEGEREGLGNGIAERASLTSWGSKSGWGPAAL